MLEKPVEIQDHPENSGNKPEEEHYFKTGVVSGDENRLGMIKDPDFARYLAEVEDKYRKYTKEHPDEADKLIDVMKPEIEEAIADRIRLEVQVKILEGHLEDARRKLDPNMIAAEGRYWNEPIWLGNLRNKEEELFRDEVSRYFELLNAMDTAAENNINLKNKKPNELIKEVVDFKLEQEAKLYGINAENMATQEMEEAIKNHKFAETAKACGLEVSDKTSEEIKEMVREEWVKMLGGRNFDEGSEIARENLEKILELKKKAEKYGFKWDIKDLSDYYTRENLDILVINVEIAEVAETAEKYFGLTFDRNDEDWTDSARKKLINFAREQLPDIYNNFDEVGDAIKRMGRVKEKAVEYGIDDSSLSSLEELEKAVNKHEELKRVRKEFTLYD